MPKKNDEAPRSWFGPKSRRKAKGILQRARKMIQFIEEMVADCPDDPKGHEFYSERSTIAKMIDEITTIMKRAGSTLSYDHADPPDDVASAMHRALYAPETPADDQDQEQSQPVPEEYGEPVGTSK